MAKRALAWFLVGVGLSACSAGDEASPPGESSAPSADAVPSSDEVTPAERDVTPVARYRFVDTSDGMTVEATTDSQVSTFSCPTRSCAGLCDECAAQACRSSGELSGACQFLVTSCNDTCTCDSPNGNCGFPVCAVDSMICYVAADTAPNGAPGAPSDPTGPSPFGPAGRPSESSSTPAPF
jgi:hypothetical protein